MGKQESSSSDTKSRAADRPRRPAWRSAWAVGLFLSLAALSLAADLLSKHYVFQSLLRDPQAVLRAQGAPTVREALSEFRRPFCPGVDLSLSTNRGVVFGLPAPRWLMVASTPVAVVAVGLLFGFSDRRAFWSHAALAFILAGALGNLYDRLFSHVVVPGFPAIENQVRDFIDCSQLHWKWVFNVADAWLVIGVGILVVRQLFAGGHKKSAA